MQGYHGQGSCLRQAAKPSPINGTQSQFSCKKTIPLDVWDVKGRSNLFALPLQRIVPKDAVRRLCRLTANWTARRRRRRLHGKNIKAQIIKHYQHLSDREAFVTAEMVRRSALGTLYLQRTPIRVSAASMRRC